MAASAPEGETITLPEGVTLSDGSSSFKHKYDAGSITFNNNSTFTLASGATLRIDGGNTIIGGTQSFAGEIAFAMANAVKNTATGGTTTRLPLLTLNASALDSDHLAGSGGVRVDSVANLTLGDVYTLIDASNANATAKGTLYVGDSNKAYEPVRSSTPGSLIYGLQLADNGRYLELVAADASTNVGLTWEGKVQTPDGDRNWDVNTTKNWTGAVFGHTVSHFLNGDDVTFSSATDGHAITVTDSGVTVNTMTVDADHTFSGGVINATTVRVNNDAKIGLTLAGQPTLVANSVTFAPAAGAGIDLTGLSLSVDQLGKAHTLLQSNNEISGLNINNNVNVVGSHSDSDFLSVMAQLSSDRKQLQVVPTLTWLDQNANSSHGNFTVSDGKSFALNVPLANNTNTASHQAGWDGTQLTKKGGGTLELAADNTYTGTTHVEAGTLNVTGSLASKVEVSNAATMGLRGTVNNQVALAQQATLNLYKGATMQHLQADGSAIGFYLPTDVVNGDVLAQVSGDAVLDSANVTLGIDGGADLPRLNGGDKVMLLRAGSLSTQGTVYDTAQIGSTLAMEVAIDQEGNDLVASFIGGTERAVEGSKSLAEGSIAGMAMVQQGGDLAADRGLVQAVQSRNSGRSLQGFGVIEGMRQEVTTGSHIELKGYNMLTGVAYNHTSAAGMHLTGGAYFEYGSADLDTFNSFASGTFLGDGKSRYVGGGLLGRLQIANGFYGEAILRGGSIKTKYHTPNLNFQGIDARFETTSPYFGVSLGGGKLLPLGDAISLDIYGRLSYTHQASDSVKLSTGEKLKFDAQSSTRLRLGVRGNYALGAEKQTLVYAGLAYEQQFSSELDATTNGAKIEAPELKGGTGIMDVGVHYRPTAQSPVAIDFGVQGYVGKRRGVAGTLKVKVGF